jgi:hypothetical protein
MSGFFGFAVGRIPGEGCADDAILRMVNELRLLTRSRGALCP